MTSDQWRAKNELWNLVSVALGHHDDADPAAVALDTAFANPDVVLRVLGMKQAGMDMRTLGDRYSSSWLMPNTNPFKPRDQRSSDET